MSGQRHGETDCPRCGHINPGGSRFCRVCGSGLAVPAPPDTPAVLRAPDASTIVDQRQHAGNREGRGQAPLILTLIAIAFAAAGVGGVLLLRGHRGPLAGSTRASVVHTTVTEVETDPTPPEGGPAQAPAGTTPGTVTRASAGEWPGGNSGYTVALASDRVRALALDAAARARAAGLPQVGVLWSSRYTSLRPGYWFVFSGVYGAMASGHAHVRQAVRAGFTDAYVRRVVR
jgi:hypothetical protein